MYRVFYFLAGFFGTTSVYVFQNSQSVIHEIEILGCILIAVLSLGFGWLTQRRWAEQKQGRGI